LPRSESNFTHNHLDFKKISGEKPQTLAYRGREGKGRGREGIKGLMLWMHLTLAIFTQKKNMQNHTVMK